MGLSRIVLTAALSLSLACGGTSKGTKPLTPKQITKLAKPAIVRVLVFGEGDKPERIGSGFIVSAAGHVATNLHVFTDLKRGVFTDVRIGFLDGRTLPVKFVVAIDAGRDLAVLSVEAKDLPTLELGDSDQAAAGDPVVAIGHPVGQFYTVSDGLISSWRMLEGADGKPTKVLQISAPISVGSSGGPLFNEYGRVIGVNTAIAREGQNLNFAIPSNYLRPLIESGGGEALQAFAKRFAPQAESNSEGQPRAITRKVPRHQPDAFSACGQTSLEQVKQAIQQAIDVGAPIYNQGNHEACFKIYKNTLALIEQNTEMCRPVRDAVGSGLLRATTTEGYKAKAWALRDTFDGLLLVIFQLIGR